MVYRRGAGADGRHGHEQEFAQINGVRIKHWARAARGWSTAGGHVTGIEFEYTQLETSGRLAGTGETFALAADMVFKAIGQTFVPDRCQRASEPIALGGRPHRGRRRAPHLAARGLGRRRLRRRRQGSHGAAVQDGKLAAELIHRR